MLCDFPVNYFHILLILTVLIALIPQSCFTTVTMINLVLEQVHTQGYQDLRASLSEMSLSLIRCEQCLGEFGNSSSSRREERSLAHLIFQILLDEEDDIAVKWRWSCLLQTAAHINGLGVAGNSLRSKRHDESQLWTFNWLKPRFSDVMYMISCNTSRLCEQKQDGSKFKRSLLCQLQRTGELLEDMARA